MLHNFDPAFERNHNCETEYIKILYYDLEENYKDIYHTNQYMRLCTITEGKKHVRINNGKEFDYTTSDFILMPPNSSVEIEITKPTRAVVYEISDKLIEDTQKRILLNYDLEMPDAESYYLKKYLFNEIAQPMARINQICMDQDPNKGFLLDLHAQELIYDLLKRKCLPPQVLLKDDPIAYTISMIMENLFNSQFTLKEVATELNISQSSLATTFKRKTGFTPKEYQNIVKLRASVHRLKEKSVTEVCYDLGFENISYFIKIFKDYYGLTPKQYALKLQRSNPVTL